MLKEDILNPRKDTLYELFSLIEYLCLGMCQKSQIFSRRDIGVLFVHDICSVCQFMTGTATVYVALLWNATLENEKASCSLICIDHV